MFPVILKNELFKFPEFTFPEALILPELMFPVILKNELFKFPEFTFPVALMLPEFIFPVILKNELFKFPEFTFPVVLKLPEITLPITLKLVSVPVLVIFGCAAVVNVPVNKLPDTFPVTVTLLLATKLP